MSAQTPLSKLFRFLLVAAGLIIALSIIWSFVDSAYSNFLTDVARKVVSKDVRLEQRGGAIYFTRGFLNVTDWIDASAIQFGLILTIALVAATPGLALGRRFLYTATAAALIFALQILAVVVMARTFNSLFFVIVSDLFPPLLWAMFSLKYWFAPPAISQPRKRQSPPNLKKQRK